MPGFPPKLRSLVEHMLISHHGELEFGSPKVPIFPEALLLHHLDNLDSKMEAMRVALCRDQLAERRVHGLDRSLGTCRSQEGAVLGWAGRSPRLRAACRSRAVAPQPEPQPIAPASPQEAPSTAAVVHPPPTTPAPSARAQAAPAYSEHAIRRKIAGCSSEVSQSVSAVVRL